MEIWSSICGAASKEVCVFPGCDSRVGVNGPSQSGRKPDISLRGRLKQDSNTEYSRATKQNNKNKADLFIARGKLSVK